MGLYPGSICVNDPIPFSISDMDFQSSPEILAALKETDEPWSIRIH